MEEKARAMPMPMRQMVDHHNSDGMSLIEFLTIGCHRKGALMRELNEARCFIGVPKSYVRKLHEIQRKKDVLIRTIGHRQLEFDLKAFLLDLKTDFDQTEVPLPAKELKFMLDEIKSQTDSAKPFPLSTSYELLKKIVCQLILHMVSNFYPDL